MTDRVYTNKPGDLDADHREALRCVAEGRSYMAQDLLLSDLMQVGLVKRDNLERVLTRKGKLEYMNIMNSGDGPESLKDMLSF